MRTQEANRLAAGVVGRPPSAPRSKRCWAVSMRKSPSSSSSFASTSISILACAPSAISSSQFLASGRRPRPSSLPSSLTSATPVRGKPPPLPAWSPASSNPARSAAAHGLSKIGPGRLRKALYFPAVTALRWNPTIRAVRVRLAAAGKPPMVIIGAAMRKLIHIAYGVLKSGKAYRTNVRPPLTNNTVSPVNPFPPTTP